MINTTKKLNIISLEELKGEIKKEESKTNSENFFIEKNINEDNDNNVGTHHGVSEKNNTSVKKIDNIDIQEKPNLKKSFIENKKKEKKKKIEFNKDLKQINKKEASKNIYIKTQKTKNIEKIYINIQEASKISGVSKNTIRKSLKNNELSYFFENRKYSLELENFLKWIFQSTRRINIMNTKGLGRFIETWKIF